jgi:hypothetical protein
MMEYKMKATQLISMLAVTLISATPSFAQSSTSTYSPAFGYSSYDGASLTAQSSTSTHSPAFGYPSYDDGQQQGHGDTRKNPSE